MRGFVLSVLALSCAADGLIDAKPQVVRALWNPAREELPTPTDLVRDNVAGLLRLPMSADQSPAEQAFRTYLNGLDGYPVNTPIRIPLSGPIDADTLSGNMWLHDDGMEASEAFLAQAEGHSVRVLAHDASGQRAPLVAGRHYSFGLVGYEGGARGGHGELVVSDAAFAWLKQAEPVTEHVDAMPGQEHAAKTLAAGKLEDVRVAFSERFETAQARFGVERARVAVLSDFTTSARPFLWFDPELSRLPFPNDLLLGEDGTLTLPQAPGDDADTIAIKAALSAYGGFSPTASVIVEYSESVTDVALASESLQLFQLPLGRPPVLVEDILRGASHKDGRMWLRPRVALAASTQYAFVVARKAPTMSGLPAEALPLGALLRSAWPLADGARSLVSTISDDVAQKLERVRRRQEPLLSMLAAEGLTDETSLVVPFTTMPTARWLTGLRERLYTDAVPTTASDVQVATPFARGLWLLLPDVENVVTGKVPTADYLDPASGHIARDYTLRAVDFVLTLPKDAAERVPVVLFGHGLETSRELVYLIANKLAQAGFAAFSIDLPMHGNRSVCQVDLECAGGASCTHGVCRHGDGSVGALRAVSSPWEGGPSYPVTSGLYFVNPFDLLASRDHFAQALVDLFQAVRVLRGEDWQAHAGTALDSDDVVYLGMSLGAILGAALTGLEPTIDDFALNAGGAGFVAMTKESSFFRPLIDLGLLRKGIARDTFEYERFEDTARWIFDPVDPINLASGPASPASTDRRVLLQMAEGDLVVPNSGTELLAERLSVPVSVFRPLISNHAFLFDPTSFEGARARQELADFFAARR